MRAILRAAGTDAASRSGPQGALWFASGERCELPELSLPELDEVPPRREVTEEDLEDEKCTTEEVSGAALLRLLPRRAASSADALPPLADPATLPELHETLASAPADEPTTGSYDSPQWDEAPGDLGLWRTPAPAEDRRPHPGPPPPRGPSLSVVRIADTLVDDDEGGRATPLPPEPRPQGFGELPLPAPRPMAFPPEGYAQEDLRTAVLYTPLSPRRRWWNARLVNVLDTLAFAFGFGATFVVGALASATVVGFGLALSLA